jgi:sigma-54 dependent transcriptional regulator, acetoin dehydrogenase operon transcriptional activator AcoR
VETPVTLHVSQRLPAHAAAVSSPFFSTPEERVDEARQRYFEHGIRPSGLVGNHVLQSWTRCLKSGRRPTDQPVFDPISRSRAAAAQERNQALITAAGPEIDQLDAALAGTGCKTVLTDRRGIVVRAGPGGGGLLELACRIGVDLGESNFGSTAPGIAAFDDALCAVAGPEHFYGVLRRIHCAAAPIHNRAGEVVGVLDVSVEGRAFSFDASSLVRLSALAIENRLLAAPQRDQLVVALQTRPSLLDTPLVAMVGFDADGQLAWANPAAGTLLPLAPCSSEPDAKRRAPVADALSLLGLDIGALLRLAHDAKDDCRAIVLPQGLMVWVRVAPPRPTPGAGPVRGSAVVMSREAPVLATVVAPVPVPRPAPELSTPTSSPAQPTAAPAVCSLDAANRALIEATLRRHHGNVSKTARELGVSRGLLYRRLKAWEDEPRAAARCSP